MLMKVHTSTVHTTLSSAGEDAIKHLLSRGTHREFGYAALFTMLVVYFLGAVWTAGSAIASGLFVPMLLIGSCIGRIVGLICVDVAASGGHGSPRFMSCPSSNCMLPISQVLAAHHSTACCPSPSCMLLITQPHAAHHQTAVAYTPTA